MRWTGIAMLILLVGGMLGWAIGSRQDSQVAHIQTARVFAEFQMTQELEGKLDNTRQARQTIIENLSFRMQAMQSRRAPLDSLETIRRELTIKKEQFGEDNAVQSDQYTEQIWTQLNQYLQEYCEAEGVTYLFGANGSGNLMGADEKHDLTEEVIAFVNQKYQNKL
ncbi:MAG: OmpH family outer membrane protein [Bacteroidota bacterium]